MGGTSNGNGGDSTTAKILAWLLNQGPSTVLLTLILFGGYQMVPAQIEAIKAGYREQALSDKENQIAQQLTFERSLKQVIDSYERQIQLMERRQEAGQ